VLALGPAVFDRDILALDIVGFLQALAKCTQSVHIHISRCTLEEADHRHRRLLRARRERPRDRRAAEQRDERAASAHSITSAAIASSLSGTFKPSALAVRRLITNSNRVGCSTGRSAGFAPLKILCTSVAARRYRSG